jgi:hypothetical protein
LGDVVGRPGRRAVQDVLRNLKSELSVDLAVVNGENAAGGAGIDAGTAQELRASGADIITLGDHAFQRKGVADFLNKSVDWCIRPFNHPAGTPGRGYCVWRNKEGLSVLVCNMMGRVFIGGGHSCPFRGLDDCLANHREDATITMCDFHAEATSEKVAMGRYADGRISMLVGTHTHVQTSDAQILPKGTAYLTDAGMCGSFAGVIGMDAEVALKRFLTPMPAPYEVAEGDIAVNGAVADINPSTGRAVWIQLLRETPSSETASPGTGRP